MIANKFGGNAILYIDRRLDETYQFGLIQNSNGKLNQTGPYAINNILGADYPERNVDVINFIPTFDGNFILATISLKGKQRAQLILDCFGNIVFELNYPINPMFGHFRLSLDRTHFYYQVIRDNNKPGRFMKIPVVVEPVAKPMGSEEGNVGSPGLLNRAYLHLKNRFFGN